MRPMRAGDNRMSGRRYVRFAPRRMLLLALLALTFAARVDARHPEQRLIIANVHVVNVRSGPLSRLMDVEVDGTRIVALRAGAAKQERGPRVYEAGGAFLVPGFWDMHIHVNHPDYV